MEIDEKTIKNFTEIFGENTDKNYEKKLLEKYMELKDFVGEEYESTLKDMYSLDPEGIKGLLDTEFGKGFLAGVKLMQMLILY